MHPDPTGSISRLKDALRLAFFVRVPESRLVPTWGEILAAVALTIFVPTAFAWLLHAADGMWSLRRLPEALLLFTAAVASAAVGGWLVRRSDAVPVLIFATLLAWVAIDALSLTLWTLARALDADNAARHAGLFFYLPLAWLALAVARFAASIGRAAGPRQLALLASTALLLAGPMIHFAPERGLWVEDPSRGSADGSRAAFLTEDVLYRQPALLRAELGAIQAHRPGVTDVFFIGVAGYGGQDVFMREVDAVAELMRERFDAGGRIVKLINNPRSLARAPMASLTSLRAALERTAAAMDHEEDVLVLFLTSHGTEDHTFQVELGPVRFAQIGPATLRRLLDLSGIRHRVVVISACYSGGFIEQLRDEHTLVIAAAAPDRNSFGCTSDADWTYFGKAYFDEALRHTRSFTEAFEIARPLIEQRERAQRFEPSRPQMAVGAAIGPKLAALQSQLAERSAIAQLDSGLRRGDEEIR